MTMTAETLREALAAFASPEPAPGGGAASALASALGSSLLLMVAQLPKTRNQSDDDRAALALAANALVAVQQQLTEAVDADTAAYNEVVQAYRRPAGAVSEKEARKAAIQRALRAATDVPLGVMRLSVDGLKHAPSIATHGVRAAASDVGVALLLLRAGLEGARLNVEINLGGILDAVYVEAVRGEAARLASQAAALGDQARAAMA